MEKIKLNEIAHCFGNEFETIRDKYDRIDENGIKIFMNGERLKEVEFAKYLGVLIDNKLKG